MPGQAMISRDQADIGGAKPGLRQGRMQRGQVGFVDMRQDHVLLVADAQFGMAIVFRPDRRSAASGRGGIAGGLAMRLQADGDDGVLRRCGAAARLVSAQARNTGSAL